MRVVDSCVWSEWVTNGRNASTYEELFSDLSVLAVPTIVVHEVVKPRAPNLHRPLPEEGNQAQVSLRR